MAINFPSNPSNGDTHAGFTYSSSVGAWRATAGVSTTLSNTAPTSPSNGDLWWNTNTSKLYISYDDGSSTQWVQAAVPGATGATGAAGSSVTSYANSSIFPSSGNSVGDFAFATNTKAVYIWDGLEWDRISAGVDESPVIITEPSTSVFLNANGSPTTVTMVASDPEGFDINYGVAYNTSGSALPSQLSTATTFNSNGVFTFTPTSNTELAGSFKARLSASDGVNSTTRLVNVSLAFQHTLYYVVVAGGGGGGSSLPAYASGGGGGAGGYRSSWNNESSGGGASAESPIVGDSGDTYTITVGAGGTGASSAGIGTNGANSSISKSGMTTITSVGGGAGGFAGSAGSPGSDGGSGGGGNHYWTSGGAGTANQGYAGGNAPGGSPYGGSGGGGAGGVGQAAHSNAYSGGNGGVGVVSTITGSSVERAGGGGGASGGTASGGGGQGANVPGDGSPGTVNTGGGGGAGGITAGGQYVSGGDGGSGVVILRSSTQATATTGSPVETTSGSDYIYQFNNNGTITF